VVDEEGEATAGKRPVLERAVLEREKPKAFPRGEGCNAFGFAKRCWTPFEKIFWRLGPREPLSKSVIMPRKMSLVLDESGGEKLGGGKYGDEALGDV
jgi:hypothetical protein